MTAHAQLGKWDRWYAGVTEPEAFGDTSTYELGAKYLARCRTVTDWGCGKGGMRLFVKPDRYRGVDGSVSPFVDEIVDLAEYTEQSEGIFMRHVLEHDYRWRDILANACAAFTKRLVLVLFTPPADETHEIAFADDPGVPDIAFCIGDLAEFFEPFKWRHETLATATQYGTETIFYVARKTAKS
jgi:hypothetical protein